MGRRSGSLVTIFSFDSLIFLARGVTNCLAMASVSESKTLPQTPIRALQGDRGHIDCHTHIWNFKERIGTHESGYRKNRSRLGYPDHRRCAPRAYHSDLIDKMPA